MRTKRFIELELHFQCCEIKALSMFQCNRHRAVTKFMKIVI